MRLKNITGVEWFVMVAFGLILTSAGVAIWAEVRGWAVKAGVVDSRLWQ